MYIGKTQKSIMNVLWQMLVTMKKAFGLIFNLCTNFVIAYKLFLMKSFNSLLN